ncbi:oligosaccharide flippase family protein [Nocardioides donggukensis]|uniref:Oligosaccharide flippase family protein n=1 Tax=Nocardioides donggukensis TaxID=2774019 RepID=A0A927K8A9_9ACTN|nr:oligosaccharide flippase family protein [Nocardioides donggukensis]MBD8869500.1 oligosaccharide flippase family protein [Nocardioides donggukensis]
MGAITHRAARNASVRGVAEILGKVATLAWTVAAARVLTQEDFGAVSFAIALMYLLSSFAAWGFDAGVMRRGSAEAAALPRVYLGSQVWKTALAVTVFGVAALLTLGSEPTRASWFVLALMLLAGFPELWSHTARAVASVRQSPTGVSTALVVQRLVTAVAIVAALAAGLGPLGLAAGFLAGTLVGWGAHHVAVRRLAVRPRLRGLTRADLRLAASGTFLIGVSGLVMMLLFRVDMVLLARLRGDAEVAVYSVAYRLLETVLFVSYAVHQAVLPVMSATSSGPRQRSAYERALAVVAFVYLPFAVVSVLEGDAVVGLLFGEGYEVESGRALAWLAPAPLLFAGSLFGTALLMALLRSRAMLVASSVALLTNLALNLVLIPPYGASGAAAATTAAYAVQTVVVLAILRGLDPRPRFLPPLVPAAVASLGLAAALALVRAPVLVELGLGAGVYLLGWVLVVRRIAPDQLSVVRQLVSRQVRR